MVGTDLSGELLQEIRGSAESCCSACTYNDACQGYAYLPKIGSCYLKTNVKGIFSNPDCISNVRPYFSVGDCSNYDYRAGYDLSGDMIESRFAPTIAGCCGACSARS